MDVIARLVVAATIAGASAACFGGTLPANEFYRLAIPDSMAARRAAAVSQSPMPADPETVSGNASMPAAAAPLEGALAIATFATPGLYGRDQIVYRIDDLEYGSYPARSWLLPLGTMLGAIAEETIAADSPVSGMVTFEPPSRTTYEYAWQATVREFEEVDRGDSVFAAVAFDARIVRVRDDSVLWTGSAADERYVPEPEMDAIVATLSILAEDVIAQLARRARTELGARITSPAQPTPIPPTPIPPPPR